MNNVRVGILSGTANAPEIVDNRIATAQHKLNCALMKIGRLPNNELGRRLSVRAISEIAKIFPEETAFLHRFNSGSTFCAPLGDGYYSSLQTPNGVYEAEVTWFIDKVLEDFRVVFVDGGSNRGFFPSYLADRVESCVAIEAAERMGDWVERNLAMNRLPNSSRLARNALWSESGEELDFSSHPRLHPGGGISAVAHAVKKAGEKTTWETATVVSISVDEAVNNLTSWPEIEQSDNAILIVKLDVEGAELQALDGATDSLAHERTLIVYEQHSSDYDDGVFHRLAELGKRQFMITPGELVPLQTFSDVTKFLDTRKSLGFNVLACDLSSSVVTTIGTA